MVILVGFEVFKSMLVRIGGDDIPGGYIQKNQILEVDVNCGVVQFLSPERLIFPLIDGATGFSLNPSRFLHNYGALKKRKIQPLSPQTVALYISITW